MTRPISFASLRQFITAGILSCVLVTGYSLLRYPQILLPLRVGTVYASVLSLVLLCYFVIVWRLTRSVDAEAAWITRRGVNWGLVIAGFWLIEIVAGNLLNPQFSVVRIAYFGASVLAFSSPFFAGIWAARGSGFARSGILNGLWSGLVSGLLTFLVLMVITYLFTNHMLQDSENMLQFKGSGAPDLVTFVIGDSLAGATGHLVIGLVLGPAFGFLGGFVGQFFSNKKLKARIP